MLFEGAIRKERLGFNFGSQNFWNLMVIERVSVSVGEQGCVRERGRAILSALTAFSAVFTWANEGTPGIKTNAAIK
jgi:hypothetical protein